MSDPMTRTDIEDVLSSIRRLVSEEARPEPPLRAPGAAPRAPDPAMPEPKLSGRLVLTPALRVAEVPDAANDGPADDAAEGPLTQEDVQPGNEDAGGGAPDVMAEAEEAFAEEIGGVAIQATIAELEAAVAARVEQWDPDGTEAAVEDENHSDAFAGPVRFFHRGAEPAEPAEPVAQGAQQAPEPQAEQIRATRVTPTRLTSGGHRRTDEGEAAETPAPRAAAISAVDALAETLAQCADAADALSDPQAPDSPAFHSGRAAAPEHEEAAAPPAEGPALDWEDSMPEGAPDFGAAHRERDVAPDSAFGDLAPEAAPETDPETGREHGDHGQWAPDGIAAGPAEAEAEGAFLEEEALREIVREIIRQELQGSLGERITRSVRKLVRAEINRAFASRDLE